jgi:hypothetical protein
MASRSRRRKLALAAVGLLVAVAFVIQRTGVLPDRTPAFDPHHFRDAPVVPAAEAASMVGERAVVCGRVVATNFAREVRGRPTYLNLERPFPDQPFDVVIWGRYRERFLVPPETHFRNRTICVSGVVTSHRSTPRIEATSPAQIREGR